MSNTEKAIGWYKKNLILFSAFAFSYDSSIENSLQSDNIPFSYQAIATTVALKKRWNFTIWELKTNNLFLVSKSEKAAYKTEVDAIERIMVNIFDVAIGKTQNVPQIERGVVDKIFWKGNALL